MLVHGIMLLGCQGNQCEPAELLTVFSHQLANFSLNEHIILAWLLDECRKHWEMHVDLQTAGDLAWFTETPVAEKVFMKTASHLH